MTIETNTKKVIVSPKDTSVPLEIVEPAVEVVEAAVDADQKDINRNEIQKLLGIDPSESKQLKINFNEELKITWTRWMRWSSSRKEKSYFRNVLTQRRFLYRGSEDKYRYYTSSNRYCQEKRSTFCGHSKLCWNGNISVRSGNINDVG